MTTLPSGPKPIEKIADKQVTTKWSDVFEVRRMGSSSELNELYQNVIKALDHLQSHRFTNTKNGLGFDGQLMMQQVAHHLNNVRKIPIIYNAAMHEGKMQNGKFVIEVHDRVQDKTVTNGTTIYHYGNPSTRQEHPITSYIGLDMLKKDKSVYDTKGQVHMEGLEALLAYQVSQFANAQKDLVLGQAMRTTVLRAFMDQSQPEVKQGKPAEQKTPPTAQPAPKTAPKAEPKPSPAQPKKSSSGKTMMAELVSPDEFPNLQTGEGEPAAMGNKTPKAVVAR